MVSSSDASDPRPPILEPASRAADVPATSRFRKYLTPLVVLAITLFLFFKVNAERSLTGRPTMDMLIGAALLNFLFYLWVRLASGWSKRVQFGSIVSAVLLQALLIATVQMEGIYGNGRPVFAWRWKPLPADQFSHPDEHELASSEIEWLPETAWWPQFRGPRRDGWAQGNSGDWETEPPVELWRQPIGAGWSSFVVAGKYCFTMEQRGDAECTTCYELETGNQVWIHEDAERFSEITGGEGPRSTPTYDNKRLYTLGATGILNCLDAHNGQVLWTVDILQAHDGTNCYYGMCASPLIADDKVIVNPGGNDASLVAYNKLNGDLIWQGGDAESSYSSPQRATLAGVDQVLNFNAEGLYSHDINDGTVLWNISWISNQDERNNVCQPIAFSRDGKDFVFVSSGYGRGSAVFEVCQEQGQFVTKPVWANKKLRSKFSSAIKLGERIYGLDEGILTCIDALTGKRIWKGGRYKHGQIVLSNVFLIVQAEDGYVAKVFAHPDVDEFVELERIEALDSRTWTHPVLARKYLLTRNDREMVCYQVLERSPKNRWW